MGELEVMFLVRKWRRHIRFVSKANVQFDFALNLPKAAEEMS